jgi:hypothetical protein
MFVRSTYNPTASSSRRPIAFPDDEPRADPFMTTTITPPKVTDPDEPRKKKVKLIRFVDNDGNVARSQNAGRQLSPEVNDNKLGGNQQPGLEEAGGEASGRSSPSSSNSLLDIGKPGNPYELIQVAFPASSRVKPRPVTTNDLVENDLTEFDPREVYFTDGNLLVLKGFIFKSNIPLHNCSSESSCPIQEFGVFFFSKQHSTHCYYGKFR